MLREAHVLLEELADAHLAGERKEYVESISTVPLLIIDDLGIRKLPSTAAENLLEIIMRRYERCSTLITSNRPVEDWAAPPRARDHVQTAPICIACGVEMAPVHKDPLRK